MATHEPNRLDTCPPATAFNEARRKQAGDDQRSVAGNFSLPHFDEFAFFSFSFFACQMPLFVTRWFLLLSLWMEDRSRDQGNKDGSTGLGWGS